MSEPLDSAAHDTLGGGPSFPLRNRAERLVFTIIWRCLSWIAPPPFGWRWRRFLLRCFGARIAAGARIYPSVRIWLPRHLEMGERATLGPGVECYNMAPVKVGAGAIVSQRAFLCTGDHDYADPTHQLVTRPIVIGAGAWVAAEAFVGPGIEIGDRSVLGARACASRNVPPRTVWAGNPARQVGERHLQGED